MLYEGFIDWRINHGQGVEGAGSTRRQFRTNTQTVHFITKIAAMQPLTKPLHDRLNARRQPPIIAEITNKGRRI